MSIKPVPRAHRELFEPTRMYSAQEVADRIGGGFHHMTVRKMIKSGRLTAIKVGPATVRLLGADLNEQLLGRKENPAGKWEIPGGAIGGSSGGKAKPRERPNP